MIMKSKQEILDISWNVQVRLNIVYSRYYLLQF